LDATPRVAEVGLSLSEGLGHGENLNNPDLEGFLRNEDQDKNQKSCRPSANQKGKVQRG